MIFPRMDLFFFIFNALFAFCVVDAPATFGRRKEKTRSNVVGEYLFCFSIKLLFLM
jgi:hypothetical protein